MEIPLYGGSILNILEAFFADLTHKREPLPDAARLSVPDQVRAQNLSFESFNVTTEDGYINVIWHVWDPSAEKLINNKTGEPRVAFLQHGLIDIAGTWFFQNSTDSVASKLAG
jgi:lysosomal acid lipase/cholesteryl ester hydrolase